MVCLREMMENAGVRFAVGFLIFTGAFASVSHAFQLELMNDTMSYIGIATASILVLFTVRELLQSRGS